MVVKGAGDCFSAGIDTRLLTGEGVEGEESVAELMQVSDEHILEAIDGFQRGFTWLPTRGSCRSRPSTATPSAPASSSLWPATFGSWPTTCSSA